MTAIDYPHDYFYVFVKVFHRWRYIRGNAFIIKNKSRFCWYSFMKDMGFEQKSDNYWAQQLNEETWINIWVWPASIWLSGDVHMLKDFLVSSCQQFGGKDCQRFNVDVDSYYKDGCTEATNIESGSN